MAWKNQESCESHLVEFRVSRRSKIQNILPTIFFVSLSCHGVFINYFEILLFAFSNTIPTGVSTCKVLGL